MGIGFRFANLNLKVYGHDEMHSLERVAGFTRVEVRRQLVNGPEIGIDEIQKFQRPNSDRDWTYVLSALATDDQQHTPLYFILTRVWMEWFGSSAAAVRSVPALLSILMFPCVYWLCRELFRSSLIGWIGMPVVAVSPFHVLYAQEARPYSLLSLAALFASAALLRAMRVQTIPMWFTYAGAVVFGLYSHLLFGLVVFGHGIYVVATERFRISRVSTLYTLSTIAAMITFAPWVIIVAENISGAEALTGTWSAMLFPLPTMAMKWAGDFGRVFVDSGWWGPEFRLSNPYFGLLTLLITLNLVAVATVLYSLWFLWRNTPKHVWLFVFILAGSTSLPLIALDFVFSRHVSASGRYLLPTYLAIQLSVSILFAATIERTGSVWRPRMWQVAGIALALSGLISCVFMSQSAVWWNHDKVYYNPSVAGIINRSSRALLISEGTAMEDFLSLSYLLNPKTRIQVVGNNASEIVSASRDIFLFRPSEALRKDLAKSYSLELLHERGGLWQLRQRLTPQHGGLG
jgi:uncharacterized membrane protein